MPIPEVVSLIPFTEILKLVISQAKKVKAFKPLFQDLASTIERLVPIFQEIDMLQETLDPGNKELNFLTKTMLRAKKMVRKCSRVRPYNIDKINSYTNEIKGIKEDFVNFCQIDLPLIQLKNKLRSRCLNMEESSPRLEGEQRVIWESFIDKDKGKQAQMDEQFAVALQESLNMEELSVRDAVELSLHDAEELHSAIQESIFLRRQQEEQVAKRKLEEDEQIANGLLYDERERITSSSSTRARLDEKVGIKDKGKGKQVKVDGEFAAALQESLKMDELSLRQAIQESIREEQVVKRRARELEKDEQIAKSLLYDESQRLTNGSSSSTRDTLEDNDLQGILWESFKK